MGIFGLGSHQIKFSYELLFFSMVLLITLSIQQAYADPPVFSFEFGDFGPSAGQFNEPVIAVVDSSDRIIVADNENHRIQVFDSTGNFEFEFGSQGSNSSQFQFPFGVAIDSSDRIIVADNGNHRIQVFNSTGDFEFEIGIGRCKIFNGDGCVDPDDAGPLELGDGQFSLPRGVATDSSGRIIVADSGNQRMQVFNLTGGFQFKFGSKCILSSGPPGGCTDPDGSGPLELGDGQFFANDEVTTDSSDRIIVIEAGNHRVQVFDSTGGFQFKFGTFCVISTNSGCVDPDGAGPLELGDGQFQDPEGVTVDSSDRIIVVDTSNHRIQVFNSTGDFQFKFGSIGNGTGEFDNPFGVGIDSSNRTIIADTNNHRIQVFSDSIDSDGDGFDSSIDCDDTNENINPNATETPGNSIDENCDGFASVIINGQFLAFLNGSQEVPPVDTNATGFAKFALNQTGDGLDFEIMLENVDLDGNQTQDTSDDVTGAHIHKAPVGVNGEIIVGFINLDTVGEQNNPLFINAAVGLIAGTITSQSLTGSLNGQALSALLDEMIAENTYINIHTVANSSGEIRGQIQPCLPPASGNWVVNSSCEMNSSATANGNVIVKNNSTLIIKPGDILTIPSGNHLLVEKLSGFLIKSNGTLRVTV